MSSKKYLSCPESYREFQETGPSCYSLREKPTFVRHQYESSALVTQTSFCEGSSGDLAKRRLFSQATGATIFWLFLAAILD